MSDRMNLNAVLAGLSSSLEFTMACSHDLTVGLFNSGAAAPQFTRGLAFPEDVPAQLAALQGNLKTFWSDDIAGTLRAMYKVMGDLLVAVQSQADVTYTGIRSPTTAFAIQEQDMVEFLQDILKDVGELLSSFEMAIARSEDIGRGFEAVNCQPVSSCSSRNGDTSSTPEPFVPPGLSPETQSFVRASISSANPDIGQSARSIISSISDTQAYLSHLRQFCVSVSSTLQNSIHDSRYPEKMHVGAPDQTLYALVESCRTGRQDVQIAIANIARSVDALVVASTYTCPIPNMSTMTKAEDTDRRIAEVLNNASLNEVAHAPEELNIQLLQAFARASLAHISFGTPPVPQDAETEPRMATTYRRTAFASMRKADNTLPVGDKVVTEVAEGKSGIGSEVVVPSVLFFNVLGAILENREDETIDKGQAPTTATSAYFWLYIFSSYQQ
ncbi:hypothetical protein JR316_0006182 [Psilocybe cubensis]|uniref:Uncharacterized protein n=2 Tax=Psilocybe cubensis TaxID=181762 RepID=A0A8H7Y0M4_PSICU|nr:hypothetical protein JR316_0006182 [Psilocybe cubensis]KAH9481655.1 hypothetical protein JR316_0006182 [Psilocybe cubensis]